MHRPPRSETKPAVPIAAVAAAVPSPGTADDLADGIGQLFSKTGGTLLFHNAGVYAEDTWQVNPRHTDLRRPLGALSLP